ncbi:hypothetical protein SAMN05421539_10981 [Jannaschia seohaensis]|uniref:Uncharacterized protein n=1 Tax=Jannaschia seohaensis TaxID=475081 RepID=A0A2Y9B2N9_9RHOB|nr:hypothetical protein BCF38_10981 [Jannaschia seohaensis]SSA49217.1 hypothetical protein SAMN05421539_10981 [Jannaschia seohaensis]
MKPSYATPIGCVCARTAPHPVDAQAAEPPASDAAHRRIGTAPRRPPAPTALARPRGATRPAARRAHSGGRRTMEFSLTLSSDPPKQDDVVTHGLIFTPPELHSAKSFAVDVTRQVHRHPHPARRPDRPRSSRAAPRPAARPGREFAYRRPRIRCPYPSLKRRSRSSRAHSCPPWPGPTHRTGKSRPTRRERGGAPRRHDRGSSRVTVARTGAAASRRAVPHSRGSARRDTSHQPPTD